MQASTDLKLLIYDMRAKNQGGMSLFVVGHLLMMSV